MRVIKYLALHFCGHERQLACGRWLQKRRELMRLESEIERESKLGYNPKRESCQRKKVAGESHRHRRPVEHGLHQAKMLTINPTPWAHRKKAHCQRVIDDGGDAYRVNDCHEFRRNPQEHLAWLFCHRRSLSLSHSTFPSHSLLLSLSGLYQRTFGCRMR